MSNENPYKLGSEQREHPHDGVKRDMLRQGFQFVALEHTHITPLGKSGRFEPVERTTADGIQRMYLEKYGPDGFTEIELVRPQRDRDGLGLHDDAYSYLVFMRRLEDVGKDLSVGE